MSNNRNIILALGCSFTDANFRADNVPDDFPEHLRCGWKMWPEIFTDRLSERDGKKYKLINAGKSGSSNEYAFRMFFEQWSTKREFLKIVLWGGTMWWRLEHVTRNINVALSHFDDNNSQLGWKRTDNHMKLNGLHEYVKFLASDTRSDKSFMKNLSLTLNKLVAVRDLCQAYEVDFIFYPILNPFPSGTYEKVGGRKHIITAEKSLDLMLKAAPSAYEDVVSSKNFIGASEFTPGWIHFARKYKKYKKYAIADNLEHPNNDKHPNAEGQIKIADEFWERYENAF